MLDHGMLNLPLSKRGNIDAQIDKYKADLAHEAKIKAKAAALATATLRTVAKAHILSLPEDRMVEFGKKVGMTPKAARKELLSKAHWYPSLLAKF